MESRDGNSFFVLLCILTKHFDGRVVLAKVVTGLLIGVTFCNEMIDNGLDEAMADTLSEVLWWRFLCDDALRRIHFDNVTGAKDWHSAAVYNGIGEDPSAALLGVPIFAIEITVYDTSSTLRHIIMVISDSSLQKKLPVFPCIGSVKIGGLKRTIHQRVGSIGIGCILVALWMFIVIWWST